MEGESAESIAVIPDSQLRPPHREGIRSLQPPHLLLRDLRMIQ